MQERNKYNDLIKYRTINDLSLSVGTNFRQSNTVYICNVNGSAHEINTLRYDKDNEIDNNLCLDSTV